MIFLIGFSDVNRYDLALRLWVEQVQKPNVVHFSVVINRSTVEDYA